jgi:hypothetical protein
MRIRGWLATHGQEVAPSEHVRGSRRILAGVIGVSQAGCVVSPGYVAPAPAYYVPASVVVAPPPVVVYARGGRPW